jgi:hypothetical protein
VTRISRPASKLVSQSAFADSGLTTDQHQPAVASRRLVHGGS